MKKTLAQIMRYGAIGLFSNVILYLVYLFITANGVEHKLTMSVVYVLGVMQTFYLNMKYTFAHNGKSGRSFFRYCVVYALGYIVNLIMLFILVDGLQFPHQLIQGMAIFLVAALLFILQKVWVFPARNYFNSEGYRD